VSSPARLIEQQQILSDEIEKITSPILLRSSGTAKSVFLNGKALFFIFLPLIILDKRW
jgi:hypothetical protein